MKHLLTRVMSIDEQDHSSYSSLATIGKEKEAPRSSIRFFEIKRSMPETELHIVGCKPIPSSASNGIHVYGRLNKDVESELVKLKSLFCDCSFFFMPSLQETFGLAYCEAVLVGYHQLRQMLGCQCNHHGQRKWNPS